ARASESSVEVITDPVGMEQVYYARLEGGWLIANSVTFLLRIIGGQPIDTRAASFFLCQSWVAEDRTLREAIRVIPAGQHWTWRHGDKVPDTREYFGIRDLSEHRRVELGDLRSALTAQVQALSKSSGMLECPITAGKDSRLLTALVLQTGA